MNTKIKYKGILAILIAAIFIGAVITPVTMGRDIGTKKIIVPEYVSHILDVLGDLDNDGDIDEDDFAVFREAFGSSLRSEQAAIADINDDDIVDQLDHEIVSAAAWNCYNPAADVNGDGEINGDDYMMVMNLVGYIEGDKHYNPAADLDGDGDIDRDDQDIVWDAVWGCYDPRADVDNDGDVDIRDCMIVMDFMVTIVRPFNSECDFDGDDVVTLLDYQIWTQYYKAYQESLLLRGTSRAVEIASARSMGRHGDGDAVGLDIDLDDGLIEPRDQWIQIDGMKGLWIEIIFTEELQSAISVDVSPSPGTPYYYMQDLQDATIVRLLFDDVIDQGTYVVSVSAPEQREEIGRFSIIYLNGDVNADGDVNELDMNEIKKQSNWWKTYPNDRFDIRADVNRDGVVTALDLARVKNSANWEETLDDSYERPPFSDLNDASEVINDAQESPQESTDEVVVNKIRPTNTVEDNKESPKSITTISYTRTISTKTKLLGSPYL